MTDDEGNDSINIDLSKANPHAKALENGVSALAVFLGKNGYIPRRWYAEKYNVPTWNYTGFHAYGTLRKIEDELMTLVDQLTIEHKTDSESLWRADRSVEKICKMLNAIVGFELKVGRWEGKQIGQNRSAEDQASLKRNLEKSADSAYQFLAQQMKTI